MSRKVSHPIFARIYARASPSLDRQGGAEHRQRLLSGVTGRVVEVGAGDGANFARYPSGVERVLAVEPEPYLRAKAVERAAEARVPVEVVDGRAEELPADDQSADVLIFSLVLCSVADQPTALQEAFRVLRPGGELRFYEHVVAEPDRRRLRRVQRAADATLWPLLTGGCHVSRDTTAAITAAGFEVGEVERFEFPPGASTPASPHVLGRAVRPIARTPGN